MESSPAKLDHTTLAPPTQNRGLHVVAMVVAVAIFPLIFIGGLVTSKDAGLSVPDWPNSYGYNMFLFPPRLWTGGILYEHTHRLYASFVGLLTIVLAGWAWVSESRRWVRWLGVSCLSMVIIQGILGGLRVIKLNLDLAIIHACIAQAFFCLVTLMAVVSSKWWHETNTQTTPAQLGKIKPLAIAAWLMIYAQLIVGAIMRHYRAGLAIPGFPFVYGKFSPPVSTEGLNAINDVRAATWEDPVTFNQIWLAFGHRIGAVLVSAIVISLAISALRRPRGFGLRTPAITLLCLLFTQLTLGVLTVLLKKPADIASTHVAVGALVLVTTFVLAARAVRLYSLSQIAKTSSSRGFAVEPQPKTLNLNVPAPSR